MKVLMMATSFPANAADWKGRFIYDMAAAVAGLQETQICLWAPPGDLPERVSCALAEQDRIRLQQLAAAGGIAHLLRRSPLKGVGRGLSLLWSLRQACSRVQPDVYHCNWLQTALALPADGRPALVTVLGTDFRLLNLPGMVWLLRRVFHGRQTLLAPNAAWMVPRLQELFGDIAEVAEIPFGVDAAWFGVQRDAGVFNDWLAVIRLTRDKLGDLLAWGEGLFGGNSGRRLHLFGPMQEQLTLPDWLVWHGPTNPLALRCDWFSRAVGLLTLSRHAEGRPQVILEAMAAGLPVLASDIPAHVDLLRHKETGYLCATREDFFAGLLALESLAENVRIGTAAQKWMRDSIGDWDLCAQRYMWAYRSLMEDKGRCASC